MYTVREVIVLFYLLFSRYGPNGTAICVYHAHFSANNLLFADDRGIVDAFNFNNFRDAKGEFEIQENLLDVSGA